MRLLIIVFILLTPKVFFGQNSVNLDSIDLNRTMDVRFYSSLEEIDSVQDAQLLSALKETNFAISNTISETDSFRKKQMYININSLSNELPSLKRSLKSYIPDLFTPVKKISFNKNNNFLELSINKPHELNASDYIMIKSSKNLHYEVKVELVNNSSTFSIKDVLPKGDTYFVYGKKVDNIVQINSSELLFLELKLSQLLLSKIEENEFISSQRATLLEEQLCEAEMKIEELTRKIRKINNQLNRK